MIDIAHFWDWNRVAVNEWTEAMRRFAACGHNKLAINDWIALRMAFSPGFVAAVKKKIDEAGVSFAGVHAPFGGQWDLLAGDEEFRPVSLYVHRKLIELLPNEFGVHSYTMHLMNDLYPGTPDDAEKHMGRVLEPLLEVASKNGVVIALENGFQEIDVPGTMPRYMRKYASENLGCCLDLAHANVIAHRRNESIDTYIDELLPYIIVCHLHDNDGQADRHWVPGDGIVDWAHCMPKLAKAPRLQSLQNESHSNALSIEELCKRFDDVVRVC